MQEIRKTMLSAAGKVADLPYTNAICATYKRHLYRVRMPIYES